MSDYSVITNETPKVVATVCSDPNTVAVSQPVQTGDSNENTGDGTNDDDTWMIVGIVFIVLFVLACILLVVLTLRQRQLKI
jgi:hypothetical protein